MLGDLSGRFFFKSRFLLLMMIKLSQQFEFRFLHKTIITNIILSQYLVHVQAKWSLNMVNTQSAFGVLKKKNAKTFGMDINEEILIDGEWEKPVSCDRVVLWRKSIQLIYFSIWKNTIHLCMYAEASPKQSKKDESCTSTTRSNMIAAFRDLGIFRISCFGHNLDLAVRKSLNCTRIQSALDII